MSVISLCNPSRVPSPFPPYRPERCPSERLRSTPVHFYLRCIDYMLAALSRASGLVTVFFHSVLYTVAGARIAAKQ